MISVGILSYNSPITLKNTLMSYSHYGLLNFSDDVFCVLQPSGKIDEEINICEEFGKNAETKAKNYTWDKVKEQYIQLWRGMI